MDMQIQYKFKYQNKVFTVTSVGYHSAIMQARAFFGGVSYALIREID